MSLGDDAFIDNLFKLLALSVWKACPVWVSGRPEAFRKKWSAHFWRPAWRVLRVSAFTRAQTSHYMVWHTKHDWYGAFHSESRNLLATPRLLKLICDTLRREIPDPPAEEDQRRQEVARLGMHTAAGVYHRAYFHVGDANDPNSQGLLAQGLRGENERAGRILDMANKSTMPGQVKRLGMVLGAVAFYIFGLNTNQDSPTPYTGGVEYDELLEKVGPKVAALGLRTLEQFGEDVHLLRQMNNHSLQFLIFNNDECDSLLAYHDRTVLTFFVAYWAMKYGSDGDQKILDRWIVDGKGERLYEFDEFWTFAAEMPDAALKQRHELTPKDLEGWLRVFRPCYTPPAQLTGSHDWVQWHRRMVYHSFPLMRTREPETIAKWRARTPEQAAILAEIETGWCDIAPGDCHYGAEPAEDRSGRVIEVKTGFRMHQYPVVNRWYEAFDPSHREDRWYEEKHPLAGVTGREGEDWCPVVKVTWY